MMDFWDTVSSKLVFYAQSTGVVISGRLGHGNDWFCWLSWKIGPETEVTSYALALFINISNIYFGPKNFSLEMMK